MLNTSILCSNRFTGDSNSKGGTYLKEGMVIKVDNNFPELDSLN